MRQTTSFAGAFGADDEPGLLLEPQPAMPAAVPASATASPTAAADLVKVTDRSPFPAYVNGTDVLRADVSGRAFCRAAASTLDGRLEWF
jgi:hypothetical protein